MKTARTTKPKTTTPQPAATKSSEAPPARKRSAKGAAKAVAAPATLETPRTTAPASTSKATLARPQPKITTELIAARAYIIWEKQGRPQGQDVANWLLAESQLMEEIQSFPA